MYEKVIEAFSSAVQYSYFIKCKGLTQLSEIKKKVYVCNKLISE